MSESNEQTSKEEQIGFHKGALTTLAKEREELAKMHNVVEQLMQMHIKSLKELGVDLEEQMKKAQEQAGKQEKEAQKKNIDELL